MPILPNNTLSSIVNLVNRASSDSVVQPPLSSATFTLDSSAVAGFFGGESAVRAMGTVYLIPQRRWLGWYNAPGAYEVAKQFSGLAKSHLFNALFTGDDRDPAKILMVDNQVGPECTPLYSSVGNAPSSIGHLGSLTARKVSQMPVKNALSLPKKNTTYTCRVTFVNLLRRTLPEELNKQELNPSSSIIFTVFMILISAGGCIACALIADWFCFASIALGIIANGMACLIIGSGKLYLYLKDNSPHRTGSRGDILLRSDTNIIVLVGNEGIGRSFTHGRFIVQRLIPHFGPEEVGPDVKDTPEANPLISMVYSSQRILQKCLTVDISVILLLFQFLAQLLLIPQGKLFGQLMFIGTLVPSWIYHLYLSTLGLDLQTDVLFKTLSIQKTDIFKYQLNTSTQAAVFACLVFRSIHKPTWLVGLEDPLGAGHIAEVDAESGAILEAQNAEAAANNAKMKARDAAEAARKIARAAVRAEAEAKSAAERAKAEAVVKMEEVAVNVVEGTTDSDKETEAARMKLEAERLALELVHKKEDAERAKAEEIAKTNALVAPEEEAERAEDAVRQAFAAQKVTAATREAEKKRKQQDKDMREKEKDRADRAFRTLLDRLLPDQTDVWRVFKDSLVRKLSATKRNNADWTWAYMESNWTFDFNDTQDVMASVQGSESFRALDTGELQELCRFQEDAEDALAAWRHGNIGDIADMFRYR